MLGVGGGSERESSATRWEWLCLAYINAVTFFKTTWELYVFISSEERYGCIHIHAAVSKEYSICVIFISTDFCTDSFMQSNRYIVYAFWFALACAIARSSLDAERLHFAGVP